MPEEIFLPDDIEHTKKQVFSAQNGGVDEALANHIIDDLSGPKNIDPKVLSKERQEEQQMFQELIFAEDRKRMYKDFRAAQFNKTNGTAVLEDKFSK